MNSTRSILCALVLLVACDGDMLPPVDAGTDSGPRVRHPEEIPPPGAFVAGISEVRIPAPLGIGTMGFGAVGVDPSVTPFADNFPGTTRAHGVLTFRAVALSRGAAHEVVFVRMDTVGVFQQLREAVLDELTTRLGRDLDDSLILAGNHTHSGPGRLLMANGALVALGDTFFPEVYDRIVSAIADAVVRAIDDQAPAELAVVMARTSDAHNDRRCENDPLDQVQEDGELPVIAVRREGRLDALVASYAYHGTVLGIEDLTLSGDMGSVVEQKVAERFDHPVLVLFFNSWGADMSPANPDLNPEIVGAEQPDGFDRMHRLGELVADAIEPALESASFAADPEVRARTYRMDLDREALGYTEQQFRYPNGGAFCGFGQEGNCESVGPIEGLDSACIRISPVENLPKQTLMTAGRVGPIHFVTAPGEWTTARARGVLYRARERAASEVMFIGYANDYTGYAVGEEDWWQGGYEASGGLWGPRQGDYLAGRLFESLETFLDRFIEPPFDEPAPIEPFSGYTYEPYAPASPIDVGTFAADVPASATASDVVTFTVRGSDPWLGAPLVTLEQDNAGVFAPVMRSTGVPVTSESYDFWVDLTPTPPYTEAAAERTFAWTFHFPVAHRTTTSIPVLSGSYRFAVRLPTASGEMTVSTGAFTVE